VRWGVVACLGLASSCASSQGEEPGSRLLRAFEAGPAPLLERDARGNVVLDVVPSDAAVWVDGVEQGIADDFDGSPRFLSVAPGIRRLELRRPGLKPWATVLVVSAEGRQRIVARLSP